MLDILKQQDFSSDCNYYWDTCYRWLDIERLKHSHVLCKQVGVHYIMVLKYISVMRLLKSGLETTAAFPIL